MELTANQSNFPVKKTSKKKLVLVIGMPYLPVFLFFQYVHLTFAFDCFFYGGLEF